MRTGRIKPGYGIVQRAVMTANIDIYSKAVYCLLVSYAGENISCFPSLSTMCNDLKISKPTLIKSLKELIANKLIVADKRKTKMGDFTSNIYYPMQIMEDTDEVVNEIYHVVNKDYNVVNQVDTKKNKEEDTSLFTNKEDNVDSFVIFIKEFNKIRQTKYQPIDKVKAAFRKRLKTHSSKEILRALENAMKDQYHIDNQFNQLTPEFITRADKLEKYLNYQVKKENANNGTTINL
jgi:hypothetical protein